MDEEVALRNKLIKYSFIAVVGLFSLLVIVTFVILIPLTSRAASNTLTLRIRVQGNRKTGDRLKARVDFYDGPDKAAEENGVEFEYKDGAFIGNIIFKSDFNFDKPYALFIKPDKHTGKLFCSTTLSGAECRTPQLRFLPAGSSFDFTSQTILAGDVNPVDGTVDAADMSNIIRELGFPNQNGEAASDINSDGITDVTDYSLAFYSLSFSAKDDTIALTAPPPAPSATPLPTETPVPAPTDEPTPVPSATPKPTATPTPTATPKPTATPAPTATPKPTPVVKVPDYTKLKDMVKNRPQIGCEGGIVKGCPITELYNKPVDKGLGWASYYGNDHGENNITAQVIKNRKTKTMEAAYKFIDDTYMAKQSHLTPEEAKKTGKVIAYGATRSPNDIWKIKYMFGINDPNKPDPYFIGRVMIIDCAASGDWYDPTPPPKDQIDLATYMWGFKGWIPSLNWFVDLSKNGFIQIPTGLSGVPSNTGEGRPGVILIDESILDEMIY